MVVVIRVSEGHRRRSDVPTRPIAIRGIRGFRENVMNLPEKVSVRSPAVAVLPNALILAQIGHFIKHHRNLVASLSINFFLNLSILERIIIGEAVVNYGLAFV